MDVRDQRLYEIVEYILNRADERGLEVVRAAVERRAAHLSRRGPMGLNPETLASEMAKTIESQVGVSTERVRSMIRDTVETVIRRHAPEISEKDLSILLDSYVKPPGANANRKSPPLPPDALLSMTKQFVDFSLGTMSVHEQTELRDKMPDWYERYWQAFPDDLKDLVRDFLKGRIPAEGFWTELKSELYG